MNEQVQQDIDSGTGQVVTEGEPVQHRDMMDGQSVGHSAEPEAEGRPEGSPPTSDDRPRDEPPPKVSRDEIYSKARNSRATETAEALDAMTPEQRANYDRMVHEASGEGPDPFAPQEEETPPQQAQRPQQRPQPGQKQPPAPAADPAQGIDQPGEMTTITVYGMQEQVPTADVEAAGGLAAFQKQRAADIRLQRLSTYEATLRNWENQLSQRAQAQPESRPQGEREATEPSPTDVPGTADVDTLAATLTDAIYSGDREEASAKLRETLGAIQDSAVRAARQNAGPSGAQPQQQPSGEDQAKAQARADANAVFRNEFPDLNTQVLRAAALNMVNEVARDPVMIGRPLSEVTREACERVREDVYGSRAIPEGYQVAQPASTDPALHQAPAQPNPTDLAGRHALKRRTVVSPLNEAHGRTPKPTATDESFPSNSEYVAKLRRGRGQPG